jgi:predicted Zn-dependent protease
LNFLCFELALNNADHRGADASLTQLSKLSNASDDKLIQTAFHGADGAVFFARQKYKDAIRELEEDSNNPLSLRLLAVAYRKTGDSSDAKHTEAVLANSNDPTLEQALIVPDFRKCIQTAACDSTLVRTSFEH